MKLTIQIICTFIIVLLISAFIAPIIFQYTDFKFHRILSRCIMIGILVATFLYVRRLDRSSLKSVILRYGLSWERQRSWKSIAQGFGTAFCVLIILMILEVFLGARYIRVNIKATFPLQLIEYIGAAFIIAFIEEFFFRGLIFNKARSVSLAFAFISTNIFYAIVHFLKPARVFIGENPSFMDSLRLFGAFLEPLMNPLAILPGCVGLFIFGCVLTYAYWKTNSLYHSIGIHAGAVFFLKADGFLLHINDQAPLIVYGDKNVYTGILGWVFMGLIGLIMMCILRSYSSSSQEILDK